MSKFAYASLLMFIGIAGIAMQIAKVHPVYMIAMAVSLSVGMPWLVELLQARRHVAHVGKELDDPFVAEVLLDGTVVATLSDREWTEMFWRRYKITPTSQEAAAIIADNCLWGECRFAFRDPRSGMVCNTAFPGGYAPFVQDGYVSLRAMYFKRDRRGDSSTKPEPASRANRR